MIARILIFAGILAGLMSQLAEAEYRAFELSVRNVQTGTERRVASTLDHIQYPEYFPLSLGESVEYVRSWMCWGRTDNFQPICPPPGETELPNQGLK